MSDLHVTIKLRNNALRSRRVALSLGSRELAEAAKISYESYLRLEGLQSSPVNKRYKVMGWTPTATKLAKFYKCSEAELFPDSIMDVVEPVIELETDAESLRGLARMAAERTPDAVLAEADVERAVQRSLGTLTEREERVLRLRFGFDEDEQTLEAIGEQFGVTDTTIGQIEKRALGKLRHPTRSNKLLMAVNGGREP